MSRMKLRVNGFTFIELLVVIATIAIIASVLYPAFSTPRPQAQSATAESQTEPFRFLPATRFLGTQYSWSFGAFTPLGQWPLLFGPTAKSAPDTRIPGLTPQPPLKPLYNEQNTPIMQP